MANGKAVGGKLGAVVALVLIGILTGCDTSLGDSGARVCDLVTNDRCSPGQMCVSPGSEKCVPAGSTAIDGACKADEDCVANAVCSKEAHGNACKPKCDYTAAKCDTGLECHRHEVSTTPDHLGYCAPPICDPVANTGCESGKACLGGSIPKCGDAGAGKLGEACKDSKDCGPQLTCIGTEKKCAKLCYAGKPTPSNLCTGNQTCNRLFDINGDELPKDQGMCKSPCHTVTDDGCKQTQACHGNSSTLTPQCGPFGTVAVDDFCTKGSDCVKGATCVPLQSGKFKCKTKCDSGKNDGSNNKNPDCKPAQICIALKDSENGKALPNNLGACGP